jgi:hypothetical protein
MAKLSDEQRRALQLMARHRHGCAEAELVEQGLGLAMLRKLLRNNLAASEIHNILAAGKHVRVTWLHITAAGRKAIA